MHRINNRKILYFILFTLFFSAVSCASRDVLISHFNNFNFKLFSIDYIKNYGAAFSLFHTHTSFLVIISTIILLVSIFYIVHNINNFTKSDLFFSSLLCSGIICNLSERIIDGFVTDFIRLNFVAFPIFNVSDMFISIGAFVLICNILFSNESKHN